MLSKNASFSFGDFHVTYHCNKLWLLLISYVQTDATLLAINSEHCCMLHVLSVCLPCCMLLCVAGSCCAKFETGQMFSCVQTDATTPNIVGPTMLGVVASLSMGLRVWPVLNFAQQFTTTRNRVWKRTQHVTFNKLRSCWPTMYIVIVNWLFYCIHQ